MLALVYSINTNAQLSFSVPVYGFHLYSAEGLPQGKGWEYGLSVLYRQIANVGPNYFVRTQFTWSPLSIYSEKYDTMISYTEKTISTALGGVFVISERDQDYLYLGMNVGYTSVSDAVFVGFSFIFEGIDLLYKSNHHKLQIELMPSILTGFENRSSHLQFKAGLAYKF